MACQLFALCFDASQPLDLAQFWSGLLGWEMTDHPDDGVALLPGDDTGFRIRFLPSRERKVGQNRMHFDLTSNSVEDQQQTVARALERGPAQDFSMFLACSHNFGDGCFERRMILLAPQPE